MFPSCYRHEPISFSAPHLTTWTAHFSKAFECRFSSSQTNMTTDVLGSGPFQQPFNKTSSAVRRAGSLMLGSPAENTLPPVSKPSAFGSPRRASIILRGLFKLVGKVLPFFNGWVMWHLGEPHHMWNSFYLVYRSKFHDYMWQFPVTGFWYGLRGAGRPHLQLICLWHKHRMMDAEMPGRKEKDKWAEMTKASFTAWFWDPWLVFIDLFSFLSHIYLQYKICHLNKCHLTIFGYSVTHWHVVFW